MGFSLVHFRNEEVEIMKLFDPQATKSRTKTPFLMSCWKSERTKESRKQFFRAWWKKNSFGENLLFIQLTMTHKFELLESEDFNISPEKNVFLLKVSFLRSWIFFRIWWLNDGKQQQWKISIKIFSWLDFVYCWIRDWWWRCCLSDKTLLALTCWSWTKWWVEAL